MRTLDRPVDASLPTTWTAVSRSPPGKAILLSRNETMRRNDETTLQTLDENPKSGYFIRLSFMRP